MIYLVRHGEAAAGWGDHPDPGLSDLGQRQAKAVAEILKEKGAVSAVCSPMQRCRETAQPFETLMDVTARVEPVVSEIATPSTVDDRVTWLRSIMAGEWQQAGDDILKWRQDLLDVLSALPPQTVVFSHFVAINAVVSALDNDPRVMVFRPGHCSVTTLENNGGKLAVTERGGEAATKVL